MHLALRNCVSETVGLYQEGHTEDRMHPAAEPAQGYVTARGIQDPAAQGEVLSRSGQPAVAEGIAVPGAPPKLGPRCTLPPGKVGSWECWGHVRGHVCKVSLS